MSGKTFALLADAVNIMKISKKRLRNLDDEAKIEKVQKRIEEHIEKVRQLAESITLAQLYMATVPQLSKLSRILDKIDSEYCEYHQHMIRNYGFFSYEAAFARSLSFRVDWMLFQKKFNNPKTRLSEMRKRKIHHFGGMDTDLTNIEDLCDGKRPLNYDPVVRKTMEKYKMINKKGYFIM